MILFIKIIHLMFTQKFQKQHHTTRFTEYNNFSSSAHLNDINSIHTLFSSNNNNTVQILAMIDLEGILQVQVLMSVSHSLFKSSLQYIDQ